MDWTEKQRRAIDSREGQILVSASAGSGKTAVLVERVIARVSDPDDPRDITRFIIVTFTNAAAAEMRSRIAAAINKKLAADPGSAFLRRQLGLIGSARISTVHAFCLRLIRENFHRLGLAPDFRLADEEESDLLRRETAAETLAARYGNPLFRELSDAVSSLRGDDALTAQLLKAYDSLVSGADPEGELARQLDMCRPSEGGDPALSVWGRAFLDPVRAEADALLRRQRICVSLLSDCGDASLSQAYLPAFEDDLTRLEDFCRALSSERWDDMSAALAELSDFPRLGVSRKITDTLLRDRLKNCRDGLKDFAERLSNGLLARDAAGVEEDADASAPLCGEFLRLVGDFSERYAAAKRARGLVDFCDLEQLAIRLLAPDGRPTDLARAVAAGADELMVDEYQDTNAAQDAVFGAIAACGCAFFAVGDVKQSIYRFRQADPGIFLGRRRRGEGELISLGENFRSKEGVLSAVNGLFSRLMSEDFGEMEYGADEALAAGSEAQRRLSRRAELDILDAEGEKEDAAEAQQVAARVAELLSQGTPVSDRAGGERPMRPSDIAVLLRSQGRLAHLIAGALGEAGIPCAAEPSGGLLDSSAVLALTDLMTAADNPTRDIELAGAMLSPLCGFTADQLGLIRLSGRREKGFYPCLLLRSREQDALGEKCRALLSLLSELRSASGSMTAGEYVAYVCERTGAMTVFSAAPGGGIRREDIERFFALASEWGDRHPAASAGELLRWTELLRARKSKKDAGRAAGEGVRIMSVHASKGLEFPAVILAGAAKRVNQQWKNENMQLHRLTGPGFMLRDPALLTQRTTLRREGATALLSREQLSEELRVLYVALTRARDILIITACRKNDARTAARLDAAALGGLSPELFRRCPSFAEWIEAAAPPEIDIRRVAAACADAAAEERRPPAPDAELAKRISGLLEWRYSGTGGEAPAKLTATAWKKLSGGGEEKGVSRLPPRFISGGSHTVGAAERGSAMHLVMQLIPFESTGDAESVRRFIASCVEREIIARPAAAALNPARVSEFFASEAGRRALGNSARARREFRFTLPVSAAEFSAGEGELLLQGVADLFWEEDDGRIRIVDYKTDRIPASQTAARAESYRPQLGVYARALAEITGKEVAGGYIYFFEPGVTVKVL